MRLDSETVPIDQVRPHPKNARRGNIKAVAESLAAHWQYRPIVVQRSTGHILVGNHTWKAAKSLNYDTIDVVWVDVDDAAGLRILVADNRTSDLGTYEDRTLATLLSEFSEDYTGTGYNADDVTKLLESISDEATGSLTVGISASERSQLYEERGIKSIVLPYPADEYEIVIAGMKALREKMKVATNGALVAKLVRAAYRKRQ